MYTTTRSGRPAMVFNNHRYNLSPYYTKAKLTANKKHWRCAKWGNNINCRAGIITIGKTVVTMTNYHNHL